MKDNLINRRERVRHSETSSPSTVVLVLTPAVKAKGNGEAMMMALERSVPPSSAISVGGKDR